MTDVLSRKAQLARIVAIETKMLDEMAKWGIHTVGERVICASIQARPLLPERIKRAQTKDPTLKHQIELARQGNHPDYQLGADGILRYRGRLYVPQEDGLRREILEEAHRTRYTVHPGSTKIYKDLRTRYCWDNMKRDVAQFVASCLT